MKSIWQNIFKKLIWISCFEIPMLALMKQKSRQLYRSIVYLISKCTEVYEGSGTSVKQTYSRPCRRSELHSIRWFVAAK